MNRRWSALLLLPALLGAAWFALPHHGFVAALRPGLLAADEDSDGRISSTELARSSPTLTSFHKIDLDQDGGLDEPELLGHLLAENPSSFDGDHKRLTPSPHDHLRYSSNLKQVRTLRVLFEYMLIEVVSVNRRIPLPSDEQMKTATMTGRLDSEESRLVAGNLVAAYQACGLQPPDFLADVEPVLAEPGLRQPSLSEPDKMPDPKSGPRFGPRGPGKARQGEGGPPPHGAHPPSIPPQKNSR